jgi:transposase-like protein
MGIFQKGKNPGAFSGGLSCPVCQSQAIRFIENLGPYRLRYRCRKCGLPFQYETGRDLGIHPYAPFKKKWQKIVDNKLTPKEFLQGRKLN